MTARARASTATRRASACRAGERPRVHRRRRCECSSGFCVGGVCCNTACTGTCQACTTALTGSANGTCASITAGTAAPAGQCAARPPLRRHRQLRRGRRLSADRLGDDVRRATCTNGTATPAQTCNGGRLHGGRAVSCSPYELQRHRVRLELRAEQRCPWGPATPAVCCPAVPRAARGGRLQGPTCNPTSPPTCGPLGTFAGATALRGSRSTARTCGLPTHQQQRHQAVAVGATLGTFPVGITGQGSRSTARTCGSPTSSATPSPSCRRPARRSAPSPLALPAGIAFDGTNMWVANYGSNNVTKLPRRARHSAPSRWVAGRMRSRATARTCGSPTRQQRHRAVADWRDARLLPCGRHPYGIAFDGTNMWVANSEATTSPSSPRRARRSAPSPWAPSRMRSRSTARTCGSHGHDSVTKLSLTGAMLGTFTLARPLGIAFDGTNMWVADGKTSSSCRRPARRSALPGSRPGDRVRRHEHVGRPTRRQHH